MRWLWALLLPVVWVPVVGLVLIAGPSVPWYAWLFGILFCGYWLRRIRVGRAGDAVAADPDGLRFSPTHRSWGLW